MRTRKRKHTRGLRGHAPPKNLTLSQSEIAENASKTVNSSVNFLIITAT